MTMWLQIYIISLVALSIKAIKVPVESISDDNINKTVSAIAEQVIPIYYVSDEANIDSYLIPPDPHKPGHVDHQVAAPATYLLPPAPDSQNEFFIKTTEPDQQSEWYPIVAEPQKQTDVIPLQEDGRIILQEVAGKQRRAKEIDRGHDVPVPSRNLLPPREDAPNEFIVLSPSVELELPSEEIDHTLNNSPNNIQVPALRDPVIYPVKLLVSPNPIPVSYITPPKMVTPEYKNPTRLYPKKFNNQFIPVPIPVSQFADESLKDVPIANSAKPMEPVINIENGYFVPSDQKDQKNHYLYKQYDQKRKLKQQHEDVNLNTATDGSSSDVLPVEQEASETNYRNTEHDEYPSELHPQHIEKHGKKSKGERTEFRMHGMKGPHSYQFGYDTGKGKNRQFRYEERDNDGHVRGHYGYVDKFGKLRVVNYDADPEHGFRAEVPVEKE